MENDFSLALGLVDYINPILYACFFIYTINKVKPLIKKRFWIPYVCGAILSLCAGLMIPTVKCIVGLGIMEFSMPVKIVAFVNTGFFISGISVFLGTLKCNAPEGTKAVVNPFSLFNSIAVIAGAFGIILIYISYIKIAIRKNRKAAVFTLCYSMAMTLFLAVVGSTWDVTQSWIHWVIEISNITAQAALFASALIIFKKKEA